MRSYETARMIFGILEIVAWTAVVAGIIAAITGANAGTYFSGRSAGLIGAVPGIALSVVGLIAAAIVQSSRAGVDSAEIAGKMLRIAEEQLRIAKDEKKTPYTRSASFDQLSANNETGPSDSPKSDDSAKISSAANGHLTPKQIIKFKGVPIAVMDDAYYIGNLRFISIDHAKAHIENAKSVGFSLPVE